VKESSVPIDAANDDRSRDRDRASAPSEGKRKYLIVVPVLVHAVRPGVCALESAFVEHLRMLRVKMGSSIDEIVLAAGSMDRAEYDATRAHLGELDQVEDGVRFVPLFEGADASKAAFLLLDMPRVLARLAREMRGAVVVHSGPSHNLFRPIEVPALAMGVALGRTTVSVTDIDERDSARMMYESGKWSRANYLRNKLVYDPIRHLVQRFIARSCDVVLLKGDKLVEDYGKGRSHVHGFYDTAFSEKDVMSEEQLARKVENVRDTGRPLELSYFGRLIYYKGVHHMIEAFAQARDANARLNIMGFGEEEAALRALVEKEGLGERVIFHPPRQYGADLFEALHGWHILMAAPLHADTPRNTWDAFACGMGILAYDTEYYTSIKRDSGAVELAAWGDRAALADRIRFLASDREAVARMLVNGVKTAHANSQEAWLERRVGWTREAMQRRR
jgi:glycosyltransferase involved in cell wall biosynthesis